MSTVLKKYFPELEQNVVEKLEALVPLYTSWNRKINVISRKDIGNLWLHHILHSLSIGMVFRFKPASIILDAGTGGGFPGIPLAILFPEITFHLVDSIGKKIKVVNEIASILNLRNVQAHQGRIEQLQGNYHFVLGRAVAPISTFFRQVKHLIKTNGMELTQSGILYLGGADAASDITRLRSKYKIYSLNEFFSEHYFAQKILIHLYDFR